jgi:hypothetical protein
VLIEPLTRFTVRLPGGLLQRIAPDQAVDLPQTVALRLLERAGGKVRAMTPLDQGNAITGQDRYLVSVRGACSGFWMDGCLLVNIQE